MSLSLQESLDSYTRVTRAKLGLEQAPIVSYLGLWILLAHFGRDLKNDEERERLGSILGLSLEQAGNFTDELLASDHPAIKSAIEVWARETLPHLTTTGKPMPSQAGLDAWANENTDGLIEKFPLALTPDTLMIMASALTVKTAWQDKFRKLDDGTMQTYGPKIHGVLDTEAAGPVAFLAPKATDGVTVLSLVAAPDVSPARVWAALDEVRENVRNGTATRPTQDGHSWTVGTTTFFSMDRVSEFVTSRHRAWREDVTLDLTNAPGVSCFAGDEIVTCKQAAMADYNDEGFVAAAVTTMGIMRSAMGGQVTVPEIKYDFTGPHAVVAMVDSGPWAHLPLFSAWVKA